MTKFPDKTKNLTRGPKLNKHNSLLSNRIHHFLDIFVDPPFSLLPFSLNPTLHPIEAKPPSVHIHMQLCMQGNNKIFMRKGSFENMMNIKICLIFTQYTYVCTCTHI